MWIGCKHAQPFSAPTTLVEDPAVWAKVEAEWSEFAEAALAYYTKGWPAESAERFKNRMQERAFLPGVTAELSLTEAKEILSAPCYDEDDRPF